MYRIIDTIQTQNKQETK